MSGKVITIAIEKALSPTEAEKLPKAPNENKANEKVIALMKELRENIVSQGLEDQYHNLLNLLDELLGEEDANKAPGVE